MILTPLHRQSLPIQDLVKKENNTLEHKQKPNSTV